MRVELRKIYKYFGDVRANDGISLVFEAGRIYGLLGENGAGKSTLMKILSGYQAPTIGMVLLDDTPTSFASPSDALRWGVGMLYQDPLDFPPLRVVENFQLAYDDHLILQLAGKSREIEARGQHFGFQMDPQSYVENLTLGERQQMELLRLLALGAEVLILDEPTTGISAEQKDVLFSTIRRLAHEEHKTIIFVSHKLEEVQELCDEVAVLRHGKLVGTETVPCPTDNLVRLMFGEEIARTQRLPYDEGPTVVSLTNVDIRTYRLDVRNITLDLHEGEVLGLAGLEGSGQQLLLRACAGLLPTHRGRIMIDAAPLKGIRSPLFWILWLALLSFVVGMVWAVLRYVQAETTGLGLAGDAVVSLLVAAGIWLVGTVLIAWTSQSPYHQFQAMGGAFVPAGRLEEGLIPGLSLAEHMALVMPGQGFIVDWNRARAETDAKIKRYNIVGQAKSLVNELSGGNQQRAMLGLLQSPLRVLLLEHPTRGLDVTSASWIWGLFQERRQEGTAIMFMSADLDELLERSDRIAVFSGGVMSRVVKSSETSVAELGHLIGGHAS